MHHQQAGLPLGDHKIMLVKLFCEGIDAWYFVIALQEGPGLSAVSIALYGALQEQILVHK